MHPPFLLFCSFIKSILGPMVILSLGRMGQDNQLLGIWKGGDKLPKSTTLELHPLPILRSFGWWARQGHRIMGSWEERRSKAAVLATQQVPEAPLHCSLCLKAGGSLFIHSPSFVEHLLCARQHSLLWGSDVNKLVTFLPSGSLHSGERGRRRRRRREREGQAIEMLRK